MPIKPFVSWKPSQTTRSPAAWIDWAPLPGPQTDALASTADVLGYGGAAGGGKSDMLLGTALTHHHRTIVFRREREQLRSIVERSQEIIGDRGTLNRGNWIWRLPGSRVLRFAGATNLVAARRFQGQAHDLMGFDEVTEIPEAVFRFLTGWNRTTRPGQRCRVIMTFNPPTTDEGRWVIYYFAPWIDPHYVGERAAPGEVRWYATIDGKETEVPAGTAGAKSRTFIPAALADNPYLLDTGYGDTIDAMPEPLRSVLKGDFAAGILDDPWQVVPTTWIDAAQARWEPNGDQGRRLSTIGVDVARGGNDRTVITHRYEDWLCQSAYPGVDTPDSASVVNLLLRQYRDDALIAVDSIGVGAAVYDTLRAQGIRCRAVNAAESYHAYDRKNLLRMANVRAELWWGMREALDPDGGDHLSLPPDQVLRGEIAAHRWAMRSNGVQIEKKDDIIKRIGRSPDLADSLALALVQTRRLGA